MGRVTQEQLGSERRRILAASRRCFLRNGLHNTSMEDVHRESGLTEDTVGRHFPSKDDLVAGIAADILETVTGFFDEVLAVEPVPPLEEVIERFARMAVALS